MTDHGVRRTRSADGTEIAYWTTGFGPPLVLVHGSLGDHNRWDALRPFLEPHFTVHSMDRRGRGGSDDGAVYSVEREYEDVAAVIDDVAARSGGPVGVYCNSFGGLITFGAAARTSNISRLSLYEAWPPVDTEAFAPPEGSLELIESLLGAGDREAALEVAYRNLVGVSDEELATFRAQPSWSARLAAAHTIPREERAFSKTRFDPGAAAEIQVPTLLLIGSESPLWGSQAETVAEALPDSRIAILEGQGHIADILAPELVARQLLAFFGADEV
jgi:pimeloyl-ACP methyl ester carboxylesterase